MNGLLTDSNGDVSAVRMQDVERRIACFDDVLDRPPVRQVNGLCAFTRAIGLIVGARPIKESDAIAAGIDLAKYAVEHFVGLPEESGP